MKTAPAARLRRLDQQVAIVEARDDLTIERITLLNVLRQPDRAYEVIMSRSFHPWEGGEDRVTGQYVVSLTELAKGALRRRAPLLALELLERARSYPPNLGEGKLRGARESDVHFYLGRAHAAAPR